MEKGLTLLAEQKMRSFTSGSEHLGLYQKSGKVIALQGQVIVSETRLLLTIISIFTLLHLIQCQLLLHDLQLKAHNL